MAKRHVAKIILKQGSLVVRYTGGMQSLQKKRGTSHFIPDYRASSVLHVDFKELHRRGVRCVALDVDGTLVPFRGIKLDRATRHFLRTQRTQMDQWCIASNRITRMLDVVGEALDMPIVATSLRVRKPKREYFDRLVAHFKVRPEEIVMVGDKLFADVWGANRAGFVTVLVQPRGVDGIHDRLVRTRTWERLVLRQARRRARRTLQR